MTRAIMIQGTGSDVGKSMIVAGLARAFSKETTIIIGDRLDADILGANRYDIDSCWFNPDSMANTSAAIPTYEVASLHDIVPALDMMQINLKQA